MLQQSMEKCHEWLQNKLSSVSGTRPACRMSQQGQSVLHLHIITSTGYNVCVAGTAIVWECKADFQDSS